MAASMRALVPNAPVVAESVSITPAKRRAKFEVPLDGMAHLSKLKATAKVNVREVHLTATTPYQGIYVPRTLAAVDALLVLLEAVRAELIEQGVTE